MILNSCFGYVGVSLIIFGACFSPLGFDDCRYLKPGPRQLFHQGWASAAAHPMEERDYDQLSVAFYSSDSSIEFVTQNELSTKHSHAVMDNFGMPGESQSYLPPIPKQETQNPTEPTNLLIQAQQKRSSCFLCFNPCCWQGN